MKSPSLKFTRPGPDLASALVLFSLLYLVFWFSPVHQVTDSSYSMMLSQGLLEHRSFALDNYAIPHLPPLAQDYAFKNGDIYQLEWVRGRLYYFFPPGTSILSIPYVAAMNLFGVSAVNPDGSYNYNGEIAIEAGLAALLMALAAVLFYYTSRLLLPRFWSFIIAAGASLGTQIFSTASRAMWSDTWVVLLFAVVVYMLLADVTAKRPLNPILLATILAWSYFVRPTSNLPILGITLYLILRRRRLLPRYLLTGACWLAAFFIYSWHNYGRLLPNYYLAKRLSFNVFFEALAGHVISPSRGLFVYVPALLFVAYLLVRHWQSIPHQPLVWLALLTIAAHLVVIAGFDHWWGGFCYGARLTTGLIPWLVLLAVVAVRAMLNDQVKLSWSRRIPLIAGSLLLAVGIFANARGAIARETWIWNVYPVDVDVRPERLWLWRDSQMLAGLIHPPLPRNVAPLVSRINFFEPEATAYLWYGWSGAEKEVRWTDGHEAAIVFRLDKPADNLMRVKAIPFIVPGTAITAQRLNIDVNGHDLGTLSLTKNEVQEYEFLLPSNALKETNVITFRLPDATSPQSLNISDDLRVLGIAVSTITFSER